ncbi:PREDICTED: squamous cell carcinoma antigen recognized by T-cells 3 isoform X4 [Lupinus angustifolius]|uniref:squamous cell carcinoma antigen recognized by T-cells 3 isoform X4 n=1 Tax=Lupinus angustifolius TaxID=3871 RepID=UPI00092F7600|nr:PREDICTED: squamous cell carcinoma antigen recognized by T-cells 3 isoform X4 [Lupinus angustifolius]
MEETLTHSEAAMEKEEPLHDSESDSESDSDSDLELSLQIQSLEAELAVNPSHYDSHFQYIKVLRIMGDVDKLTKARESMSQLFPLSPSMWQEWIKDELSLKPDFSAVLNLYERALFDYLSVSLWCDYINFVQEFDSIAGTSKVRDLFESALAAAGLHISEGSQLWESYRLYEQAILLTIDESDTDAKDKQIQHIRTLFHRQLSVPLADMTSTLTAYKIWEAEQGNDLHEVDINPHVASSYQKALDMYNARKHFEQQICSQEDIPDSQRLQHYLNYLKFEQSSGTPARVQVLYERAITDFPISPDLWLDYTRYLDKTLKVGNIVSNVYCRATKNCPWVGELWVRYLLCLERSHASEKDLAKVFEKSLLCTFSTYDERASDYLSPHLKNTEVLLHLHAYWAHLEAKLGKDLTAARGVWENFLKICGSMLEVWKGYITMEVELGHINETRSIYKRCYSKRFSGTGSEDICHSWLRFEREFGKLEDLDHALQKVTPRLEELKLFRIQQESKLAEENENNPKRNARDKRKLGPDITDEQSPAKLLRDAGRNPTKAPDENKHQVQNSSEVTKVEVINQKNNISDNLNEQHSTTRKSRAYSDQHTAFISNIHPTANYEHIRNFFSDVGGVVAIRILHDKFTGKSRGLAYVDFIDDEHLASAVAKNKHRLLGKKLSIARSDPKRGGKETSDPNALKEHVSKETDDTSKEDGKVSSKKRGNDNIQLKGKNTFAVPRNVRPLGFPANKPKAEEEGDEKPKSNDEFRKMFIR